MSDNWNVDGLSKNNIVHIAGSLDGSNSSCCGSEEIDKNFCSGSEDVSEGSSSCCDSGDIATDYSCGCGLNESLDDSKIANPISPKTEITDNFMNDFKEFVKKFNISDIAYVNNIKNYFLNGFKFDFNSAIVFTIEMDQRILDEEAGDKAQEYNNELYENFGNIVYEISDYLRMNGFETKAAHPREDLIDFLHLGEKAGLGCVGNSGLLISPEFGPKQKIAAILVNINNLPIVDKNEHLWIKQYCNRCGACLKACPQNALINKELNEIKLDSNDLISKNSGGVKLDSNKCVGCSKGCTECIQVCPFYKKSYSKMRNIFEKMNAKKS